MNFYGYIQCQSCIAFALYGSQQSPVNPFKHAIFSISFEYYGIPPLTFVWYINDEFYEWVDSTTSHGTHTMVFTDTSLGGWYQCVIVNEFGIDNYTSFVEIAGNALYNVDTW